uniref:Transposon Ty2-OR1 Gag-Pol polyprotein n=1 Tax=Talaromyces marneffei PM1 TaxID=1077442 RepID=A0A093UWB3_TALMA
MSIHLREVRSTDLRMYKQYVAQRALGAYIASVSQPEALFDLSFAAQTTQPGKKDRKVLNKRLQWQIDNPTRGLRFVKIDLRTAQLYAFVDASFANNKDSSSQIGHVIVLADAQNNANILHWSSTKCKRVARSVLASETYAMANGFDVAAVIKSTLTQLLHLSEPIPLVLCTDSKSLYECLVKLGTTREKRLMIDLMCLRQAYERQEITEVRWINGNTNPADAMTKSKPCRALQELIDMNKLRIDVDGWVERPSTKRNPTSKNVRFATPAATPDL